MRMGIATAPIAAVLCIGAAPASAAQNQVSGVQTLGATGPPACTDPLGVIHDDRRSSPMLA